MIYDIEIKDIYKGCIERKRDFLKYLSISILKYYNYRISYTFKKNEVKPDVRNCFSNEKKKKFIFQYSL